MEPYSFSVEENYQVEPLIATDFFIADLDLRSGSTDLIKISYKASNENLTKMSNRHKFLLVNDTSSPLHIIE